MTVTFELNENEQRSFSDWKQQLPVINQSKFRELYTFSFQPTGLGIVKTVSREDGFSKNITDYNSW